MPAAKSFIFISLHLLSPEGGGELPYETDGDARRLA